MGQQASAASQPGQSNNGAFSEDAFRHFKDNKGSWAQNNGNQMPSGSDYNMNNYNNNSNAMSLPMNGVSPMNSMMNGVSAIGQGVTRSCLYTDVTRPNGPMDRAAPMDMERHPGNRDSFSTHNLNQPPPFVTPPPPAKAEASTMMSTAFLQRNSQPEDGPGGYVQFKIDTVHEECQVSESYTDCPQQDNSSAEREVQILEEKLRIAKEKAAAEEEARKRRTGASGKSDKDKDQESRMEKLEKEIQELRCAEAEFRKAQSDVGVATYDEVMPQDPYNMDGMMTSDMPIMAPVMHHTPQKGSPGPPGPMPVERGRSTDIDMCSGFESHLTSISQRRPQQTPVPSNVGSCMSRAVNVVDELKERENWNVGTVIEVFSSSASKWYIAQLVEVGEKATAHMITVQFVGDTGQIMQKSMPRSDVQIAPFGRNTRQMPPGFQKVSSESRPGQFSYQDSSSGQKYQTKELAWQNYYAAILKSEQAQQLLRQQSLRATPSPEASAAERLAAEKLKPPSLQAAPTMSLGPTPPRAKAQASDLSSDFYAGAHGPDPILAETSPFQPANTPTPAHHNAAHQMPRAKDLYASGGYDDTGSNAMRPSYNNASTMGDLRSLQHQAVPQTKPGTVGDLSSLAKSKTPFPGYGQSFAVGTNAGYEAYLASQGMS